MNILGLDIGTNSIGWALISANEEGKPLGILGMGSRIIPMSQDILSNFNKGVSVSQTAERTKFRGVRRLRERHLLRRERLHRVLKILGFLPDHYANQIDFENHFGKFIPNAEPKLAYDQNRKFIFKKSFEEMLTDFRLHQPSLFYTKTNGKETRIPYDWTIYYLRQKALTQKIEKEELAWLLLNFNQKRGYYQIRGEESEETPNKKIEYHSLKVVEVNADNPQEGKSEVWYNVLLENGWIYRRSSKLPMFDWKDKIKEFIVTTEINDDGSEKQDREGKVRRSFRSPDENDWNLVKTKTEQTIHHSGKTVGQYIYSNLLENPSQKLNGKLVRVIERNLYRNELVKILQVQSEFHQELRNQGLYRNCIEELYGHNEAHRQSIANRGFDHLFIEDIIFYQRPLKSKKSLIANCNFERRKFINKNGVECVEPLKCIAKSHPLFQEFRLWQWIQNLHIFSIENSDYPVTSEFLRSEEDYVNLFDFLNNRKDIDQESLLKYLLSPKKLKSKELKVELQKYRWNYVIDKSYPCNETRSLMQSRLEKCLIHVQEFLKKEIEEELWHILYSVNDKIDLEKALSKFAERYQLSTEFVSLFKKHPPYKNEYGSFSAKAIKKLLPLMRMGKYWDKNNIHEQTKLRIGKLMTAEFDETIKSRVREKSIHLETIEQYKGLPLWLASYIVYDRHSEAQHLVKWKSPQDIADFLNPKVEGHFRQHSLRNPIVEQVIAETLRVVKDIWQFYGKGVKDFFSEIHIELGREMKNPANKRKQMTESVVDNENTNLRIKALLAEMAHYDDIENVRPHSPMQHEILKIYEEGVLNSSKEIDTEILKISKTAQPSKSELLKYKLWLQQKYLSPYTGKVIPLSKLFTPAYEIEHIIPQSRFFDDSFSNKVICESEVNKLKDNLLAFEFIHQNEGQKIELSGGKFSTILTVDQYVQFVKDHYVNSYGKAKKLMLLDIPEAMVERQLNDTRFISKEVKNLLSRIVRKDQNDEGVTANNVLSTNGQITSALKQDWGLNEVWNEIISSRFQRLNILTNSQNFGSINPNTQKFLPTVPLEISRGFNKKRIDHRHHALDALIIACTTRNHINYSNNQYALDRAKSKTERQKSRDDLKYLLCEKKFNIGSENNYKWIFKKPWNDITKDTRVQLEKTIVCFKQNLRVINKTVNKYHKWEMTDGKLEKVLAAQTKGDSWAIRKPLHKDTISGKVNLPWVKVSKDKILTATRKSLDISFDKKTISSITDTGIQKILNYYLEIKGGNPEIAFTAEGISDMNNNIKLYNGGKSHKPILKVRLYEEGSKFAVGSIGNKKSKYVEGAKGTNLFFTIYTDLDGKRTYCSVPFNEVLISQKQGAALRLKPQSVPLTNANGDPLLFSLSPNDLVFVPSTEEMQDHALVDFKNLTADQVSRIYKCVSFTGNQCFFIKHEVSVPIYNKFEYSSLNKSENTIEGFQIKSRCWKLEVDRLGKVAACTKGPKGIAAYKPSEKVENLVSEPLLKSDRKRNLHFPESFDQMELDQLKYFSSLSPQDLWSLLKNLSLKAFGFNDESELPPHDKKLKFDL